MAKIPHENASTHRQPVKSKLLESLKKGLYKLKTLKKLLFKTTRTKEKEQASDT